MFDFVDYLKVVGLILGVIALAAVAYSSAAIAATLWGLWGFLAWLLGFILVMPALFMWSGNRWG